MSGLIGAYVTNLGKYNEGELACALVMFPTTKEKVQAALKKIGVDGVRYEEVFISDYECNVEGLGQYLGEYESIDELNHFAHLLDELDPGRLKDFEAALRISTYTSSLQDLINLVHNIDKYDFYPGVTTEEELGRLYVEDFCTIEIPENIVDYFDFEAYGRDMRINEGGDFVNGGYAICTSDKFVEVYGGRDDIPPEHKVFAYPVVPIREQMAAYQEKAEQAAIAAPKEAPAHEER